MKCPCCQAVCNAHSVLVFVIGYRELEVGWENISLDHAFLRGHPKVCTHRLQSGPRGSGCQSEEAGHLEVGAKDLQECTRERTEGEEE